MGADLNDAVSKALDQSQQPEQDALSLLHYLIDRFGWAGTVMMRADVESIADRELTDDEWEEVRSTKSWRDMGSTWLELGGWEPVRVALEEAGIEVGDA